MTTRNGWRSAMGWPATQGTEGQQSHARVLSLIEHKTALRIYVIAALAILALWASEWLSGVITPHDRWAQPMLALLMTCLCVHLRRNPASLVVTQRVGVAGLGLYFAVASVCALRITPEQVAPYWLADDLLWMPVISLLLHLTFPWRWALRLSLGLLALIALPAAWMTWHDGAGAHGATLRSLLINGVLMQLTFLVSLVSVDRLKHGVGLIVAGDQEGPKDAHAALASWLKDHTDELARARDAAEEASRAKSRFLAVMSHELRTPLHAMMVSADLIADRGGLPADPGRDARLVHTIQSSGQHLLTLIDQVLELSRIEAGKVEAQEQALDIGAVVHKACAAVKPMAELKGLKLLIGLPDDLPRLRMGDELRLTQVLINLLANATKFTLQGHISLTLRPMPEAPSGEDWLRLSVIDTGQGMSESEQTRVFEAFYQVDSHSTRQQGGVGLGLTITQELVALMKGRLSLRSKPGQGTRIDVDLPMPVLHDAPPATGPRPHSPRRLDGVQLLVVDDDDVNRMLVSEVLQGAGATVHSVDNGVAALAWLRRQRPDAVLMDWRMPGMDGLETTRRLRQGDAGERSRTVAVIGLTANAFEEDRQACLASGMAAVLTKPVARDLLLDEVMRCLQPEGAADTAQTTPPQERGAG